MTSPTVVARLVPVIAHAVAVFGDEQSATHRLSTPLAILEYRTPTELLASDEGIELVERALDRNRECRTGSKRYGAMQSSACSDTSAINLHVSE